MTQPNQPVEGNKVELPPLEISKDDFRRTDEGYQDLGGSDVFFYTTKDKDDNGEQLYSLAQMFCCRERQLISALHDVETQKKRADDNADQMKSDAVKFNRIINTLERDLLQEQARSAALRDELNSRLSQLSPQEPQDCQQSRSLLTECLPHLDYKLTHTQTAQGRKNVARLIERVNDFVRGKKPQNIEWPEACVSEGILHTAANEYGTLGKIARELQMYRKLKSSLEPQK